MMFRFTRAASLSLAAALSYSLLEPLRLVVRRFEVALPHLPPAVEGLRIGHLSDLHCSAITPPAVIRRAVALCNAAQPDVVVLTGDYVSRRNSYSRFTGARRWAKPLWEYAQKMAAELSRLKAAEGVFAVPGNHDHAQGSFADIAGLLREAGVCPLVNRSVRLRKVLPLIGVDDLRAGRPLLKQACEGVTFGEAQVMLSHNPRLVWRAAGRNCLLLTGHTHGGQVHLPFIGFRRRPGDMIGTPWHQGWYRVGQAQMYVNAGVGSVHFPMRFRCPPEIAILTLVRA